MFEDKNNYSGLNEEMFGSEAKNRSDNNFGENSYTEEMVEGAYNKYSANSSHVTTYLLNGEVVLWEGTGKPPKGVNMAQMIFPIFWTGFSIFWTVMASMAGGFFGLFGVPFILIGIFLFKQMKGDTSEKIYAITNKRLIIVSDSNLDAIFLNDIANVRITSSSVHCTLNSTRRYRSNGHTRYANITKDIYNSPENLPEIHRVLSQAISDFVL